MAKGKRKKRKPGAGHAVPTVDIDSILEEVESVIPQLDTPEAGPAWGHIQRLLAKAKADSASVGRAVMARDIEQIRHIMNVLRGLEEEESDIQEVLPDIPSDTLRDAMKAFRKRLKLMKLDHESKLGRSPLTGGKDAGFDSILPPEQFPAEVWKVLAANGELESTGRGFYKIPEERPSF